jgi:NAD(P)-dependent dehydrogenase (short-subunit alcohol dehydrogenase family)
VIRVNTIAPGGVETEGVHSAEIIGSDLEMQMAADAPLGRLGQPDDIADVAVFLSSDNAPWVTGERITASAACARYRVRRVGQRPVECTATDTVAVCCEHTAQLLIAY